MRTAIVGIIAAACLAVSGLAPGQGQEASEVKTLVRDNNQFALALYGQLNKGTGNLFFSPYSITSALAMTYGGARGKTAEAMARTLHFELPAAQVPPAFGALNRQLLGDSRQRGFQLSIANALWAQKGYAFLPAYLDLVRKNYDAGVQEVDFQAAPENARQTINRWVETETRDKIKDLVPQGALTPMTRLVLTNAIYFKSAWQNEFAKQMTKMQPFTTAGGSKLQVPLMYGIRETSYHANEQLQLLELPYSGHGLSLVVVLPKQADRLGAVEQQLTAERLEQWLKAAKQHEVNVYLPRFKVSAGFDLNQVLSQLGMGMAFTDSADFSGMSTQEKLQISQVLHKAFIDLNEQGTEAAAATAVIIKATAALPRQLPRATFRADHPFVFLIRDNRTGSILFMGRLQNPE